MRVNQPRTEMEYNVNNLWTNLTLWNGVLEMLCGEDGAYGTTEIADRLRAPYASVRNVLQKMKRQGIVRSKTLGSRNNQTIWWLK